VVNLKWKNAIFILFIISLIIYNGGINAFAMNTGFSTSEMNVKEKVFFFLTLIYLQYMMSHKKAQLHVLMLVRTV
jgi:hypothetical protein